MGRPVKGHAKIELFNAKGDKVDEINKHNFIAPGIFNYYFYYQMMDTFVNGERSHNFGLSGGSVQGRNNMTGMVGDPFQMLWLTDADHPEDPEEEWVPRGKMSGFAYSDSSYSGSDSQRGTVNTTESFIDNSKLHFVFDFPTDVANGTFQSLYFRSKEADSGSYYNFFKMTDIFDGYSSLSFVQVYDGKFYFVASNSSYDDVLCQCNIDTLKIEKETKLSKLHYSFKDFCIKGGYLYVAHSSKSRGIGRAPLSDPDNVTTLVEGEFHGICYDEENKTFYASKQDKQGSDYHALITSYDSDFNVKNVENDIVFTGVFDIPDGLVFDDGIVFIGKNIAAGDTATQICGSRILGFYKDGYITSDKHFRHKINIGSRVRLKNPVTKTEEYTMKVTYDIILNSEAFIPSFLR